MQDLIKMGDENQEFNQILDGFKSKGPGIFFDVGNADNAENELVADEKFKSIIAKIVEIYESNSGLVTSEDLPAFEKYLDEVFKVVEKSVIAAFDEELEEENIARGIGINDEDPDTIPQSVLDGWKKRGEIEGGYAITTSDFDTSLFKGIAKKCVTEARKIEGAEIENDIKIQQALLQVLGERFNNEYNIGNHKLAQDYKKYYNIVRLATKDKISELGSGLKSEIERIIDSNIKKENEAAATKIQSAFRGFQGRKVAGELRELKKRDDAARVIQKAWRRYKKPAQVAQNEEEAAIKIQSAWRGYKASKESNQARLELAEKLGQEAEKLKQENAAIKIQSAWRGYKARKDPQNPHSNDDPNAPITDDANDPSDPNAPITDPSPKSRQKIAPFPRAYDREGFGRDELNKNADRNYEAYRKEFEKEHKGKSISLEAYKEELAKKHKDTLYSLIHGHSYDLLTTKKQAEIRHTMIAELVEKKRKEIIDNHKAKIAQEEERRKAELESLKSKREQQDSKIKQRREEQDEAARAAKKTEEENENTDRSDGAQENAQENNDDAVKDIPSQETIELRKQEDEKSKSDRQKQDEELKAAYDKKIADQNKIFEQDLAQKTEELELNPPQIDEEEFSKRYNKFYQEITSGNNDEIRKDDAIILNKSGFSCVSFDVGQEHQLTNQVNVAMAAQKGQKGQKGPERFQAVFVKFRGTIRTPIRKNEEGKWEYEESDPPSVIIHSNNGSVTKTFVSWKKIKEYEDLAQEFYEANREELDQKARQNFRDLEEGVEKEEKIAAAIRSVVRKEVEKQTQIDIEKARQQSAIHYQDHEEVFSAITAKYGKSSLSSNSVKNAVKSLKKLENPKGTVGVSIAKQVEDPYTAKVLFRQDHLDDWDQTFDTTYINIPGSSLLMAARVADATGHVKYYVDGEARYKKAQPGEVVMDENTVFQFDKQTNSYIPVVVERKSRIPLRTTAASKKITYKEDNPEKGVKLKSAKLVVGAAGMRDFLGRYRKMTIQAVSSYDGKTFCATKLAGSSRIFTCEMSKAAGKDVEITKKLPEIEDIEMLNDPYQNGDHAYVEIPQFAQDSYKADKDLDDGEKGSHAMQRAKNLRLKVCVVRKTGTVILNDGTVVTLKAGTKYVEPLPYENGKVVARRDLKNIYGEKFFQELKKVKPAIQLRDEFRQKEQEFFNAIKENNTQKVQEIIDDYKARQQKVAQIINSGNFAKSDNDVKVKMMQKMMEANSFDIFVQTPKSKGSMNALHLAVKSGNSEVAILLMQSGLFDINVRSDVKDIGYKHNLFGYFDKVDAGLKRYSKGITGSSDSRKRTWSQREQGDFLSPKEAERFASDTSQNNPQYQGMSVKEMIEQRVKLSPKSSDRFEKLQEEMSKQDDNKIKSQNREILAQERCKKALSQHKNDQVSFNDLSQNLLVAVEQKNQEQIKQILAKYQENQQKIDNIFAQNNFLPHENAKIQRAFNFALDAKNSEGKDVLQIAIENDNQELIHDLVNAGFIVKEHHVLANPSLELSEEKLKLLGQDGIKTFYAEIGEDQGKKVFMRAQYLDKSQIISGKKYNAGDLVIGEKTVMIADENGFRCYNIDEEEPSISSAELSSNLISDIKGCFKNPTKHFEKGRVYDEGDLSKPTENFPKINPKTGILPSPAAIPSSASQLSTSRQVGQAGAGGGITRF